MSHRVQTWIVVAATAIAVAACGGDDEGATDVCFTPATFPSSVEVPPALANSGLGGLLGCGAAIEGPPPGGGNSSLCEDSCTNLVLCGLSADFADCVSQCGALVDDCAPAFECFRDADCEDALTECSDEAQACQ